MPRRQVFSASCQCSLFFFFLVSCVKSHSCIFSLVCHQWRNNVTLKVTTLWNYPLNDWTVIRKMISSVLISCMCYNECILYIAHRFYFYLIFRTLLVPSDFKFGHCTVYVNSGMEDLEDPLGFLKYRDSCSKYFKKDVVCTWDMCVWRDKPAPAVSTSLWSIDRGLTQFIFPWF